MLLDVSQRRRPPRREDYRIEERDLPKRDPLQQVGPEHDPTPDVVPRDRRPLQPPSLDELGQHTPLRGDGDVLPLVPLRLPEAHQIVDVHRMTPRQPAHHTPPQRRTARRAVHEHHRRPLPKHPVSHLATLRQHPPPELPSTVQDHPS